MDRLRKLFCLSNENYSLKNALIEVCEKYDAPLPAELLPDLIKEAIKNIK